LRLEEQTMGKGRRKLVVDKAMLEQALQTVEADGPLVNQHEVWIKAADLYNSNPTVPEPITHSVVMLRAKEFGLTIKTPPGRHRITSGQQQAGVQSQTSRSTKFQRGPKKASLDQVEADTPDECKHFVRKARRGSMKALVALKCLDCSGWQKREVRECPVVGCPLWVIRPYQSKTNEQKAE